MMGQADHQQNWLLSSLDLDPVELVNANSDHPVVLVCEHAGQAVPSVLNGLGLPPGAMDAHIGWDIGARAVTLRLAEALGAPGGRNRRACVRVCVEVPVPPGVCTFCLGVPHDEILEKPDRPLRCPYLPTYLPTLLMGN